MKVRKALTPLLLLPLLTQLCLCQPVLDSVCTSPEVHRFLVVSEAKIQKSKHLQYSLKLFDTPVVVNRTASGTLFQGNFSRLVLRNIQTKKETVYEGREMVFKFPANHVFNLQKIPDLQIQINHAAVDADADTPIPFIMVSQTYMMSKFASSINTVLSNNIHREMKDGDLVKTGEIVKILEGFPMLMYRGSAESYPCRSDLLCFLKREYQLLGHEDFQLIKQFLFKEGGSKQPKKAFKRKSLFQIHPFKTNSPKRSNSGEQL